MVYVASLKEIVDLKMEKEHAEDRAELYHQQSCVETQGNEQLRMKLFKEKFPEPTSDN